MTDTATMAADEAPNDFPVSCAVCGAMPARNAGANWLANHMRTKHPGPAGGTERSTSPAPIELTAAEKKLCADLQTSLAMPMLIIIAMNMTDGMLLVKGVPDLVQALVLASRKSKQLRHFLHMVVESIVWLAVGTAVANIALPILDNHGVISIPGYRVKDRLGADMIVPGHEQRPSRPAPGAPTSAPSPGATVADPTAGMNRAARRAVEVDPGPIPPNVTAIAERFGVSTSDLTDIAAKLGYTSKLDYT